MRRVNADPTGNQNSFVSLGTPRQSERIGTLFQPIRLRAFACSDYGTSHSFPPKVAHERHPLRGAAYRGISLPQVWASGWHTADRNSQHGSSEQPLRAQIVSSSSSALLTNREHKKRP